MATRCADALPTQIWLPGCLLLCCRLRKVWTLTAELQHYASCNREEAEPRAGLLTRAWCFLELAAAEQLQSRWVPTATRELRYERVCRTRLAPEVWTPLAGGGDAQGAASETWKWSTAAARTQMLSLIGARPGYPCGGEMRVLPGLRIGYVCAAMGRGGSPSNRQWSPAAGVCKPLSSVYCCTNERSPIYFCAAWQDG